MTETDQRQHHSNASEDDALHPVSRVDGFRPGLTEWLLLALLMAACGGALVVYLADMLHRYGG